MTKGLPDVPLNPVKIHEEKKPVPEADLGKPLGLDVHAAALADFVSDCATPMTIGIQGDWGSGKTSLMKLVDYRIRFGAKGKRKEKSAPISVWFNTWQYSQFSQQERLGISMLMNLSHKLRATKGDNWSPKATAAFKRFAKGLLRATTMIGGGIVSGALTGASVSGEALLRAFEHENEQLDDARLFEKLRDDFQEIVGEVIEATNAPKVIFYVDDLDRLQPVRAIELLEVLKNFADVEGAVFVLAIDYDVILRGLQERKGYQGHEMQAEEGKSFFDKIIQVPYRMPTTSYNSAGFFLSEFLRIYGGDKEGLSDRDKKPREGLTEHDKKFVETNAKRMIEASIGSNPRSIKRLLNLHSLLASLTRNYRGSKGGYFLKGQMAQLLVLTCIQVAHFRLYALLSRHGTSVDYLLIALILLPEIDAFLSLEGDGETDLDDERLDELIEKASFDYGATLCASDDAPRRFQEAVGIVVDEVSRMGERWNKRTSRQWRVLSKLMFEAIDSSGNGKFEPSEKNALRDVLQLAASTSLGIEVEEDKKKKKKGQWTSTSFQVLSKTKTPDSRGQPLLRPGDCLVFQDVDSERASQSLPRTRIEPDFEFQGVTMKVKCSATGDSITLKEATRRILDVLRTEHNASLSPMEERGNYKPWDYWAVERGDERTPLGTLLSLYASIKESKEEREEEEPPEFGVGAPEPEL